MQPESNLGPLNKQSQFRTELRSNKAIIQELYTHRFHMLVACWWRETCLRFRRNNHSCVAAVRWVARREVGAGEAGKLWSCQAPMRGVKHKFTFMIILAAAEISHQLIYLFRSCICRAYTPLTRPQFVLLTPIPTLALLSPPEFQCYQRGREW